FENSSVAENVRHKIKKFPRGRVFSIENIPETYGNKEAIQRNLSRLAQKGEIYRIRNGIYYKPLRNKFLKGRIVPPNVDEALKVISKKYNEKIQLHGGAAANKLGLSTQVPTIYVYYTSGVTRELEIAGIHVKLIHTNNEALIKYAGTNIGLAIAALQYLGKELVSEEVILKIRENLTDKEFQKLMKAHIADWMHKTLIKYSDINNAC
ncbi:TPA: DUF6088 family protein, partial [Acinetobacter baumannii]